MQEEGAAAVFNLMSLLVGVYKMFINVYEMYIYIKCWRIYKMFMYINVGVYKTDS